MKKVLLVSLIVLGAALAVFFVFRYRSQKSAPAVSDNNQTETAVSDTSTAGTNSSNQSQPVADQSSHSAATDAASNVSVPNNFQPPLSRAGERVTKKPFGIYVTPQNSPVSPERFRGYHTGADFEIFPEELNADVKVQAVCPGDILVKRYAGGYGGMVIESCTLEGNPITVIYGHLKLTSIKLRTGDPVNEGDVIGLLGANMSNETSGERKHLHLGFHKGKSINTFGYVQNQANLSGWIDPCLYVCHD